MALTRVPVKEFDSQCGEFGDLVIEFAQKSVGGSEWSCKIDKLTDTAPDAIRLDMTCYDYNLGLSINPRDPNVYERKYKEVMLLKRIAENTMSVRKTSNGKFKYPGWRADYCSDEMQRMYLDAKAKEKAEAEQKAADEHPWRPQAGIYAIPGTNFDDRCLKSGDAIIELAERSISTGADTCNVTFIRNEPNALQMFVTCDTAPNARDAIGSYAEGRSNPAPSRPETIILKKIDDKTVFLQMTKNRKFVDAAENCLTAARKHRKYTRNKRTRSERTPVLQLIPLRARHAFPTTQRSQARARTDSAITRHATRQITNPHAPATPCSISIRPLSSRL